MRKFIFVLSLIALGGGLMAVLPALAQKEGLLMVAKTASLYDFTMDDIDGKSVNLGTYRGKVLLLVNTASLCGNTPQYTDLERIYEQYHDQGFEVLAFPANNFGQQEPGTNAEIKGFCLTKYSVSFPLFSKSRAHFRER
jgi:glutathione peroxidase